MTLTRLTLAVMILLATVITMWVVGTTLSTILQDRPEPRHRKDDTE